MVENERHLAVVRTFAASGKIPDGDDAFLGQAIDRGVLQLLQKSLPESLRLAKRLLKQSEPHSRVIRFECQRALARAAHMSGKYEIAEQAYLEARKLAGDWDKSARIDRALIDVYMYLGDYGASRRRRNLAVSSFRKLGKEAEMAKTEVNYANVLHRQDRHREAEALYRDAAELFESNGDELSAARCLYNRANTLVQLFRFSEAETVYEKSSKLYGAHNFEKDATDAEWGLAWMHMLKGDFHVALQKLNECEITYRKIGVPMRVASCELDRAEVYLQLSLFEEAVDSAKRAESMFRKLAVRYEASKAALYAAYAAHALENNRLALNSVRRAKLGFKHDDNAGFLGAAELLEAKLSRKLNNRIDLFKKASNRFANNQLPLWQAICDINALQLRDLASKALNRLKKNPAVEEIPSLFSAYHVARGDNEALAGKTKRAVQHWRMAADRLDSVKAALPPIELQSAFGRESKNPHLRLIRTLADSDPQTAAIWSERFKTSGVWAPPPSLDEALKERGKVSQSLGELSQYVLSLSRSLGGSDARLTMSDASGRKLRELRKEIRQAFIELERQTNSSGVMHDEIETWLAKFSQKLPIVQYHVGADDILCFVHEKGGSRVHRIPNGPNIVASLAAKWSFLLEGVAMSGNGFSAADQKREQKIFDEIGEIFWVPLEIDPRYNQVLVIPEGQLASLPWAAIKPNGCAMVERHQIILSPSLRHYVKANDVNVESTRSALFMGDASHLNHASEERDMIASSMCEPPALHDPCRRESWPEEGGWNIWHYTGHAMLNVRNPFYSSLSLEDGAFFAADLRLRKVRLNLATIAACHSGTEVALPGEESTGFVRSFLEMGARNVLAGHWSVSDRSSLDWMGHFYGDIADGKNISKAAQNAALHVKEKYRSAYYWAVFSVFGVGV